MKISFAADSERLNWNGGDVGMHAGSLMASLMVTMKQVWATGIFLHFLLKGLGARGDEDDDDALISACTHANLIVTALDEFSRLYGSGVVGLGGTQ